MTSTRVPLLGSRRSLGWIPFKKSAIRYRNGQVWVSGIDKPLSLWDSYGLAHYQLGAGCISEDARGRWYLNLCVRVVTRPRGVAIEATEALGVDLGLKDFMTPSTGATVTAQRCYRDLEPQLAVAQRADKKDRVRVFVRRNSIGKAWRVSSSVPSGRTPPVPARTPRLNRWSPSCAD